MTSISERRDTATRTAWLPMSTSTSGAVRGWPRRSWRAAGNTRLKCRGRNEEWQDMRDEKMMIYKNLLLAGLLLLFARPAHAMHITEGILPFNWAAAWFVVAAQFWPLCG